MRWGRVSPASVRGGVCNVTVYILPLTPGMICASSALLKHRGYSSGMAYLSVMQKSRAITFGELVHQPDRAHRCHWTSRHPSLKPINPGRRTVLELQGHVSHRHRVATQRNRNSSDHLWTFPAWMCGIVHLRSTCAQVRLEILFGAVLHLPFPETNCPNVFGLFQRCTACIR